MINFNLRTTTGIYVGTRNVYIAQLKGTLFGLRLVKFARTEIQPQSQTRPADLSKEKTTALVKAIKKVIRENNLKAKKVITALPGQEVIIRYFQMPKIPKSERETAIKFEAKKYIPFKIEELIWDFHVVLPKDKEKNKMDITFVAVKKEAAQRHLTLLKEAGLKVQVLEPAPFSLVRMLTFSKQLEKDRPVAIVDIDDGMADINIVKNRICYLTRDVSLPLEEELIFENLANEIRMSLDYYEKLFPAEMVSKILLCGEVELGDWDKDLAEELKIVVEKADPLKAIDFETPLPLNMAVAIGLTLRGRTRRVQEVNLLQVRKVEPAVSTAKEFLELTPQIRRAIVRALVVSCIGLMLLYVATYRQVFQKRKELKQKISLRPTVHLPISSFSFSELQDLEKELTEKLSSLVLIIDKRILWTIKFNELSKIIVPGLWLTDLYFSEEITKDNRANRSLNIKGVAYHEDPVQEIGMITKFVSNLKENKGFSDGLGEITLESMASVQLQEKVVKEFSISCKK